MYIFFKSLFPENLKRSIKNISFIRYIQLNFKIKFSLRKKLKKQLKFKRLPIEENKFLKKKVFIPLIETYGEEVSLAPNTALIIHKNLIKLIDESKNK